MGKHAIKLITSGGFWISIVLSFGPIIVFEGWTGWEISHDRFLILALAWLVLSVVLFILGCCFIEGWPNPTTFGQEEISYYKTKEGRDGK